MGVGGCSGVVCVFRLVWWVCRLGRVHVMTALGSSGRGDGGGRLSVLVGRNRVFRTGGAGRRSAGES